MRRKISKFKILFFVAVFAPVSLLSFSPRFALGADLVVTAENGLSCAGARYGADLGCTAGEFATVVNITNASGGSSCTDGGYFDLEALVDMTNNKPDRYDVGFFTGENGNDPRLASGTCSVATFPTTPDPWFDGDDDACGDFKARSTSSPTVKNLRVFCTGNSNGQLLVPYVVTYQQNTNQACTGPTDVSSGSKSKCNSGTATVTNVVVKPRPAAYYRFNESRWTGTTGEVKDSSDNGLDGTSQGSANTDNPSPAIAGDPGTCRYGVFDGDGDAVVVSNDNRLNGTNALTYAAWIYPRNKDALQIVMGKGHWQQGVYQGAAIYVQGGSLIGQVIISGSAQTVETSLPALDTWSHVSMVYDGANLILYVNGSPAATSPLTGTLSTNTVPLTIGGDTDGHGFYGYLDEARVYTSALLQNQVQAIMEETHPCPAATANGACESVFPSPLQNSDLAGEIDFGWDAQALYDPDGALDTNHLNFNSQGVPTCGTADCTASGEASTPAILPPFSDSTSTTNVSGNNNETIVLSQSDYNQINIGWRGSLEDNGFSTTYHINTLSSNSEDTITLQGGTDYYIGTLNVGSYNTINVGGSGTARLFVNSVSVGYYTTINANGTPDQLLIVPYNGLSLNTGEPINALVYSPGDITVGSNMGLAGALASPAKITLGSGTHMRYDRAAVLAVDARGLCGGLPTGPDHLEISSSTGGTGLTCAPTTLTIKACADNVQPCTPYTDGVTGNMGASGTQTVNWIGGASFTIPSGSSTITKEVQVTTPGPVQFGTENLDPVATGAPPTTCDFDPNCSFTAYESGFVYSIPDLTSCQSSSEIGIQAVRTDDHTKACVADNSFAGKQKTLKFSASYVSPATGSRALQVTPDGGVAYSVDPTAGAVGIPLNFDSSSATAKFSVAYNDAGKVGLAASYTGSGEAQGLLMNGEATFVVTPDHFTVAATEDGTTPLNNTGPSGAPHWKAGADFTAQVAAVCQDGTVTPNFAWDTNLAAVAPFTPAASSGGVLGTLSNGAVNAGSFVNGIATLNNVRYTEVGNMTLQATATGYQNAVGADLSGTSGVVGRFTPDHFAVAVNLPEFHTACAPGNFTYIGEPFDYAIAPVLTVTAQNKQNATTHNYTSSWWKITNASLSGKSYAVLTGTLDLGLLPGTDPVIADAGGGSGTLTFSSGGGIAFTRGATPVAPFDAEIGLSINVADADGILYPGNPATFGTPTAGSGIAFDNGKQVRYGRLDLLNAYGSELLPLDIPLQAEYFDGNGFVTNSADSCTAYNSGDLTFGTYYPNLASGDTTKSGSGTLASGTDAGSPFQLTAPGSGNEGSVDLSLTVQNWLKFDWNGDGTEDDPTARATFGVFKGNPDLIYTREMYR